MQNQSCSLENQSGAAIYFHWDFHVLGVKQKHRFVPLQSTAWCFYKPCYRKLGFRYFISTVDDFECYDAVGIKSRLLLHLCGFAEGYPLLLVRSQTQWNTCLKRHVHIAFSNRNKTEMNLRTPILLQHIKETTKLEEHDQISSASCFKRKHRAYCFLRNDWSLVRSNKRLREVNIA